MGKVGIMIPTFNEQDNIAQLLEKIIEQDFGKHEIDILVVDDDSPDDTPKIVTEYSKKDPRVHLMTRKKRCNRGSAGIDGFKRLIEDRCDYIFEMDGDLSHNPKYLPSLLQAVENGADVALGSRFVPGGKDQDRGFYRQFVTLLAGFYVRRLLKIKINDVSSGYRCFTRKALEMIDLDDLISTGPSIVLEILYRCVLRGLKIVERPIVFIDRRQGTTKLNWVTLLETLTMVLRLRDMHRQGKIHF